MYGSSYFDSEKNVMYKGSFKPEQIDHIHGSWGLVWDGNSIEGCEGELGNYLKINAPHKISLYIAAELSEKVRKGDVLYEIIKKVRL